MRRLVVFVSTILMSLVMCLVTSSSQVALAQNLEISSTSVISINLKEMDSDLRIIALANGSAEILSSLGLRNSIIGRDIASTTKSLKSIPIVTSGHQVIAEKVIVLKPTLVIIDSNVGPKSAIDAIKKAKIKVVIIPEAWNLIDGYKKINAIGKAVNEEVKAKLLVSKMQKTIGESKNSLNWKPKIAFLYLRGPSSIYLIGGAKSGVDSLATALGAIDVGAKYLPNPFNSLTSEALVKANPDVILVMTKGLQSVGGINGLMKLPGVLLTSAGKSKRILSVDDSLLLSFGPRTPSLLKQMSEALRALK